MPSLYGPVEHGAVIFCRNLIPVACLLHIRGADDDNENTKVSIAIEKGNGFLYLYKELNYSLHQFH
jgi:hypothetical protein